MEKTEINKSNLMNTIEIAYIIGYCLYLFIQLFY